MDVVEALPAILREGGAIAALVLFVVGLKQEWWVMGTAYREVVKARDEYKHIAFRALGATEKVADVVMAVNERRVERDRNG